MRKDDVKDEYSKMSAFSGHTHLSMLHAWLMRRSKRYVQAHKAPASAAGTKGQHCQCPHAHQVLLKTLRGRSSGEHTLWLLPRRSRAQP